LFFHMNNELQDKFLNLLVNEKSSFIEDYNYVQQELKNIDDLIAQNNKDLIDYSKSLHSSEIKLRSLSISKDYKEWTQEINLMIEIIRDIHNNKIISLQRMMEQLKQSQKALNHPINHQKVILLDKTRMNELERFPTFAKLVSMTKKHSINKIVYNEKRIEFIDTQGLDDTEEADNVILRLEAMIKEINWQYTSVFYLLSYDVITKKLITKIINFLQDLFGNNIVERTILVITRCPPERRFKTFCECRQLLLSDYVNDKEMINKVSLFKAVKFVDLLEPNNSMEDDEKEISINKRRKERKLILEEFLKFNFTISHPGLLKQYILKFIYESVKKMTDLKETVTSAITTFDIIKDRKNFMFVMNKMFYYFVENKEMMKFYSIDELLSKKLYNLYTKFKK